MPSKRSNKSRLLIVFFIVFLAFAYTAFKLFSVQMASEQRVQDLADQQYLMEIKLAPRRGLICDRNGKELAVSMDVPSVCAYLHKLEDKSKTIRALHKILGVDEELLRDRFNKQKHFVWVKRKVSKEEAWAVQEAHLPGIEFVNESKRFYPHGNLASHVLGFVNIDNEGQIGAERAFNSYLKGERGFRRTYKDAKKREVFSLSQLNTSSRDGDKILLSIDTIIQYIAEREIQKVYEKHSPKSISIIVMDPSSGEILAMANRPTFDPNEINSSTPDMRRNRAIMDMYEPGSTFKVVAASGALEEGLFETNEMVFCENGEYKVAGRRKKLHDYHSYGWLTFEDVISKSSNIGTVKIAQRMGKNMLYRYIDLFGFGKKTGISLPGEQAGIFHPLKKWTACSISALPIGQEIAVSPLQLACAFSAIANDGVLVRPRILKRIENSEGVEIGSYEENFGRRVVSKETAQTMKRILEKVVSSGTARRAYLKGYRFAGKTGTAQKIDEIRGGYAENKYVASFVGFAPADEPAILVLVMVNEPPYSVRFGGTIAAPIFKAVAEDVLRYIENNGRVYGRNYRKDHKQNQG